MPDGKKFISGEDYTETLVFDKNAVKAGRFAILSYPYSLNEAEFNILKEEDKGFGLWIKRLQLIGFGYILTILSKVGVFIFNFQTAENKSEKAELKIGVENWEFLSILIVIFLLVVMGFGKRYVESEREELISKISSHFKKNN